MKLRRKLNEWFVDEVNKDICTSQPLRDVVQFSKERKGIASKQQQVV